MEVDLDEDEENNDMEGGSQPSSNLDIPPLQTDAPESEPADIPHVEVSLVMDESPLYEVREWISLLASRIEELDVVEDSCFSSIEARFDSYETRLTSQYEQLQQRVNQFEERVMRFLESVFPPPPPPS